MFALPQRTEFLIKMVLNFVNKAAISFVEVAKILSEDFIFW